MKVFREEEYVVDKWLVEPKAKKPVTDPAKRSKRQELLTMNS